MLTPRIAIFLSSLKTETRLRFLILVGLSVLTSLPAVFAAEPEARIFHGTAVTASNIPTARLVINTDTMSAMCSSVVLSPKVLISAAHCFAGIGNILSITVSAPDGTRAYGLAYSVDSENDLSYVRLDRNISKKIKPVKLASSLPRYGESLLILGYGLDEQGNVGRLISGTMTTYVTDGRIILAVSPPGGSTACRGDSGGPAFLFRKGKPYLVGVSSFGEASCTVGLSGYTSVLSVSAKRFLQAALKKAKGH